MLGRGKGKKAKELKFIGITQCSPATAAKVMKKAKYDMERALGHYYDNIHLYPAPIKKNKEASKEDLKKLDTMFNGYCEMKEDSTTTSAEGFEKLHTDLGIDFTGKGPFLLAFKLNCKTYGQMTRDEFKKGFGGTWGVFTISDMKSKVSTMKSDITGDRDKFTAMYNWTFRYMKENDQKKTIPQVYAHAVWTVLLKDHDPKLPLLEKFLEYVETTEKAVTFDTWKESRKFLMTCSDVDKFENDGAWPTLVDNFLDKIGEAS